MYGETGCTMWRIKRATEHRCIADQPRLTAGCGCVHRSQRNRKG
eukprot:COSAG06_NODE_58522_length_276_cov_138.638418_1_plen_43_part_01